MNNTGIFNKGLNNHSKMYKGYKTAWHFKLILYLIILENIIQMYAFSFLTRNKMDVVKERIQ